MNRIDRLSAILILLQSRSTVKPKDIIKRFGIGIRTVYRDIRALEEAGIPITGDSRLGYSLVEGYKLPPLMFTEEEAFAFLAAEKLVDKFTDSGVRDSYKLGVDKIRAVMRIVEKKTITDMTQKIGTLDFNAPVVNDAYNHLQIILDSIAQQNKIQLNYLSHSKNEITERIIDPIGVFFSMSNWYCIGYCNNRKDYRTFKINRIKNITQSLIPIDKNHPPLESILQNLKTQTELQKVIIEVNRKDLPIIDDTKYYQGLIMEKNLDENDLIELHFRVFSLERFARWYLSYIDIAKIKFPKSVSDIVHSILKKTII